MAVTYFLGQAVAVAQVDTVTVANSPDGTTFTILIGGEAIAVVVGDGEDDTTTIAEALVAAFNNSTNPYVLKVTATSAAAVVTLTSDVEGLPFTTTDTEDGGAGTLTTATTVANDGPNVWDSADNWSNGIPGASAGDIAVVEKSSVNICWGLDQGDLSEEVDELRIAASYTGRLGLDRTRFAITADGQGYSPTAKAEYRDTYLKIEVTRLVIGNGDGQGSPRLKIHPDPASATTIDVQSTVARGAEYPLPAVRFKTDSDATDILHVRNAPGGVGVGADAPDEDCKLAKVSVAAGNSWVQTGPGVEVTLWEQYGGNNLLWSDATVGAIDVFGGTLTVEGEFLVTAYTIEAGTCYLNNYVDSGDTVTTANLNAGLTSFVGNTYAQQIGTNNPRKGAQLARDENLTITTPNYPSTESVMTF